MSIAVPAGTDIFLGRGYNLGRLFGRHLYHGYDDPCSHSWGDAGSGAARWTLIREVEAGFTRAALLANVSVKSLGVSNHGPTTDTEACTSVPVGDSKWGMASATMITKIGGSFYQVPVLPPQGPSHPPHTHTPHGCSRSAPRIAYSLPSARPPYYPCHPATPSTPPPCAWFLSLNPS